MKASIIIPVFNNANFTEKCILSLIKNTNNKLIDEIIVVNNASTDNTKEVLDKFNYIKVSNQKININFAGACNIGANLAKAEILIFLNNDTEVQNGWLEPIIDLYENNETLGAVGVKLIFPEGTIQHAGVPGFDGGR